MYIDFLNIGLGFLEGFALIISPCILPILPLMLAGSLTGSKKRPLGLICGFIILFSLFTLFSRKLVQVSGIDLNLIRYLSYGLLFLLGVIMTSTYLTEKFTLFTHRLSHWGSSLSSLNPLQEDFIGGLIFGGLVALIWTPCAGPILATIIVQTVIQQTNFMSFLTILAFAAGAAGPMLLIAFFGRSIMPKLVFFKTHTILFRKLLGLIIILTIGYLIYFENNLPSAITPNSSTQTPAEMRQDLTQPSTDH